MAPTSRSLLASLLIPGLCFAQSQGSIDTSGWTPPPLIDAPVESSRLSSGGLQGPATPPPPGYAVPPTTAPGLAPGSSGTVPPGAYPYTPYGGLGTAEQLKPPEPEIGLMVSESLFGMLTSAGTALIPYYLLLKPLADPSSGTDPSLINLVFILTFSAVPLAVSQTELSLANGSRYYVSDSWSSALGGLVAQAMVVGAYYLLRPGMTDGGEALLLIGTVGFVPIAEMAVLNLFKTPRYKAGYSGTGSLFSYSPEGGVHPGLPLPRPIFRSADRGLVGIGLSLLTGRF